VLFQAVGSASRRAASTRWSRWGSSIYKGTRVVNFGQGEQAMLGDFALVLHTFLGLPFGISLAGALVLAAAGVLTRLILRPWRRVRP
jgi:branched-subunit amino acid ABC-type transport system permease component